MMKRGENVLCYSGLRVCINLRHALFSCVFGIGSYQWSCSVNNYRKLSMVYVKDEFMFLCRDREFFFFLISISFPLASIHFIVPSGQHSFLLFLGCRRLLLHRKMGKCIWTGICAFPVVASILLLQAYFMRDTFSRPLFCPRSFLWASSEVSGKEFVDGCAFPLCLKLLGFLHCCASPFSNLLKNNLSEGNLSHFHGVQHHLLQVSALIMSLLWCICVSLNFGLVIWLVTSVVMCLTKAVNLHFPSLFCYTSKSWCSFQLSP